MYYSDIELQQLFEKSKKDNAIMVGSEIRSLISQLLEYREVSSRQQNGALTPTLTFNQLREANIARLPQFRNSKGELAHSQKDGSDWTASQWLEAVVGEIGEYANKHKKYVRGDINREEFREEAKKELADVVIYLDILAYQFRIDLGVAVRQKFNEVSDRIKCVVKL